MATYTVVLYNQLYRDVTYNAIGGMFLAAKLESMTALPLVVATDSGCSSLEPFLPKACAIIEEAIDNTFEPSKFGATTKVAQPKIRRTRSTGLVGVSVPNFKRAVTAPAVLTPSSNPVKARFLAQFPKLGSVIKKNIIYGTRYDHNGTAIARLVATFDDPAVIQGYVAFYTQYNQYPLFSTVLRNTDTDAWVLYQPTINVMKAGHGETYIAPKIITIKGLEKSEPISLTSPHRFGWKRKYLFEELDRSLKTFLPKVKGHNVTIAGLHAVDGVTYTLEFLVTPEHAIPDALFDACTATVPLHALR